jgi:1,5-anhydro-D-fructose reductase (1,5-anhydro-D-mannitol-forming)
MPPTSATTRDTIRWGIIGCGDVTEVKSGPALQQAVGSRLVAVMRRNGALAADYARRHGVQRWYDDARALVADPEVDAVYVATPPGAHLEGALLAAAAGKPAYVEKPMARHTPECDAMIAAFAAARQKLFIAYYRRALPRFLEVKDLIESGALGHMTGVAYRQSMSLPANASPASGGWRIDAVNSGGGLLLDVGSHVLDLLDFLCGPLPLDAIRSHAAHLSSEGEVEDAVTMIFRTRDGVPGSAAWNFASHVREDHLEFTGTAGRVSVSVFGNEPVRLETTRGIEHFNLPHPPHVQLPLLQTIVDELLGRGTCPSTAESGRRTSAVMDRVLESFYGGRSGEFWNRPESWPGRGGSAI